MSSKKLYVEVDGLKWPRNGFPEENFHKIHNLTMQHGDLVINTYPRCGTHLTFCMIWSIINDGKPLPKYEELMKDITLIDRFGVAPLEQQLVSGSFRKMISHTPLPFFPFDSVAKYVVTIRNPFDCCTSAFHFLKSRLSNQEETFNFEECFELFMSGEFSYGDYFDHLLNWLEHRNDPNVKILIYEKIIKDRRRCVLELAEFLGEEYSNRMRDDVVEEILESTSFTEMKTKLDNVTGSLLKGVSFIRKGVVGSWRDIFSDSQADRLKTKMQEKLKDSEVLDFWLQELGV